MKRLTPIPLVLALLVLPATPAAAAVKALLVGVSDYHYLDADLLGPRNDVALVAQMLLTRGAEAGDIRVLASAGAALPAGLAPPEDPTRAAIIAGLQRLAQEAGPGDTVIFYYSGHGSQAPDLDGDEGGGMDEILLPADVRGWQGAFGAVENAIVDDELQVLMQAILDTGAQVVGIIDACHSATGFRDPGGAGVARYVPPVMLGVPAEIESMAEAAPGAGVKEPPAGNFVFLYSSQSDERSFEYPLGAPDDPSAWYGDFTRNLVAALTTVPDLTWGQALAAAADGLRQAQAPQTPDGEGPALAAPVFGSAPVEGRMRVEDGVLMEGLLSGLSEGAEVELFDAAAGGASLGRARLRRPEAGRSELELLEGAAPLPAIAYAELLSPGLPPTLRMAPPLLPEGKAENFASVLELLDELVAGNLVDGLEWAGADPAEGYDLRLIASDDALALVGRDGVLDADGPGSSPRIAADAGRAELLAFLERAVRRQRLQAALAQAEGRRSGFGIQGAGLSVQGEVLAGLSAADGCDSEEAAAETRPLVDGAALRECDQIWLTLANGSRRAQDVTVLYVDAEMRIVPIWPPADLSNRIAFGEHAEVGLQLRSEGGGAGIEEIIVIAVPARDGAPRTVLTGLAEAVPSRAIEGASDTAAWLLAAADPDSQAREFRRDARTDAVKVTRIRIRLEGRESALGAEAAGRG